MRISRLDLLAYGRFTDAKLDLPARVPDLHLVFGLNEAGKSTALAAIEDLLFGIIHNTPYGFVHEYNAMRLGAVLTESGRPLEFRRRKGKGDTLLNTEGLPISGGESVLRPFLNGADREFYSRMFCLDHERLRQGGRDILNADDDVGRILFSVGAGVVGLKDRVAKLREEADALWDKRRASHRKYYQAENRLQAAENTVREQLVTAKKWHELKDALEKANGEFSALEAQIETKTADARKLSRIRRVYRYVRRQADIAARLEQLTPFPALPENAGKLLSDTLDSESEAKIRIAAACDQIAALRKERASYAYDEVLLMRGDDIRRLHEVRIRTRNQKDDLPKRRAELAVAEDRLKRLAEEITWDADDPAQVIARLPARAKLADARSLSQKRGSLTAAFESARTARQEADARVAELTQDIEGEGVSRDVSSLVATIQAIKAAGDFDVKIVTAELDAQTATVSIAKLLNSLRPSLPDKFDLASLPVPPTVSVKDYRDRQRDLSQRIRFCGDQIRDAELNTVRLDNEYKRTTSEQRAVSTEELAQLRAHRDTGWSIIRRKYVEGDDVTPAEIQAFGSAGALPEAYEAALKRADLAADQRYETAEATAKLAEIARQIAEQKEELEVLRGQLAAYDQDETKLAAEWTALWSGAKISPLSADEMLIWLETRAKILEALDSKASADRKLANLQTDEQKAKECLLAELVVLKVDAPRADDGRPLRVLIELAEAVQRGDETKATNLRKLEKGLSKAKTEAATKLKGTKEAEDALTAWTTKWSAAVTALGLDPGGSPGSIEAQITIIDEMRETARDINDLRHERIEKIERDIAAFETEVAQLVLVLAPQMHALAAEDAVLNMESLLQQAEQARELAKSFDDKLAVEQEKLTGLERQSATSRRTIESLQAKAGVPSVDELRIAIDRSNELRSLRAEREQIEKGLLQDGDGLSLTDLANECQSANLDQIASHEETITQELSDLRNRQIAAGQVHKSAQDAFEGIGGDDRVARAAADRQSAFAAMRDVAEQYIRVRSAELLLQHAIERYRREKQAPLLKRAGELFATLTGGSFKDLQVEFGDGDEMKIVGIRRAGQKVGVSGMTGGTVDQLYLALRVAAMEDYLSRSTPLPFIADDLFINFDDTRAAAGFKVLGELAKKIQVLFFTHHRHLIEVADAALDTNVSVIDLASATNVRDSDLAEDHLDRPASA